MTNENNYNSAETERQILNDVDKVRGHENEYGNPVDVVGRRPAGDGDYEYKLSDGRVVSNEDAWNLANAHKLNGFIGSHNHGRKHIKTTPDGNPDNNIGNLPGF